MSLSAKTWITPAAGALFACAAALAALAGCGAPSAGSENGRTPAQTPPTAQGPQAYDPSKAFLPLDEIPPRIELPAAAQPKAEPAETPLRIRRTLAEADELFAQRRYTEAIMTLEKGLRFSPARFELHRMLGIVCFHSGSTGRAKGHLKRAVELNPDDVACHYLLGRLAGAAGDRASQIAELRLALKCSDAAGSAEGMLAHLWLGAALEAEGYLTAAIGEFEAYDRLLAEAPPALVDEVQRSDASQFAATDVLERLSDLSARLGRFDRAVEWMARAVRLAPEGPQRAELLVRYATLAARVGRPDEARGVVRQLLQEASPAREDLEKLAAIYAAMGQPESLLDDLRLVAAADPQDTALWSLLAEALIQADRPGEAEEVLSEVIAQGPPGPESYWQLARLQDRAGRPCEALVTLSQAVRAFPGEHEVAAAEAESLSGLSPETLLPTCSTVLADRPTDGASRYLLGRVAARAGLAADAESLFREAIEATADFLPPYLSLGERYLEDFRWDDALALGHRAINAGQDTPSIQRLLARAYDGLDRVEEAEQAYQAAIQGNRQDSASIIDLADMWARLGNDHKARRQYQSALAVNPAEARAYEALVHAHLTAGEPHLASEMMGRMRRYAGSTITYARTKAWYDYVIGLHQEDADRQALLEGYLGELARLTEAYPDDPDVARDLAEVYYALDRKELASKTAAAALAKHPHHLATRELLTRLRNRNLAFDESEQMLRALVADYPNRGPYWTQLAQLLLVKQDWPKAIAALTELVDRPFLSAWRAELQAELLNVLDLTGRSDQAVALAREWLAADPSDAWARQLVSTTLQSAGRTDELVAFLEAEYAKSPSDPSVRALLLSAYQADKRFDVALARLIGWLEADPEEQGYRSLLLSTLMQAKAYDSAVELVRNMRATDDEGAGDVLVNVLLLAGRDDEAVRVCRSLPRSNPAEYSSRYATVLMRAGRYKEAERVLVSLEKRVYRTKQVLLQLAFCYQRMDENEAAENALVRILEFAPRDAEILNDLGYTWADAGKSLERAEEMIREAVAARPRTAAYLDSLGWVRYKRGDFTEAVKWLRMATQARPAMAAAGGVGWISEPSGPAPGDDPIIYDHLGDAEYRLGNMGEAENAWRQALAHHAGALELSNGRDDSDIIKKVEEKLAALARGEPPEVAPVGPADAGQAGG